MASERAPWLRSKITWKRIMSGFLAGSAVKAFSSAGWTTQGVSEPGTISAPGQLLGQLRDLSAESIGLRALPTL